MTTPATPSLEWVEVSQFEAITARGTREVTWFWRAAKGDGWVNVAELPGAERERLEPGRGMVWETRIRAQMAYGSWLMRVESRPGRPERLDALEYLKRDRRQVARQVLRQHFRVGRRGGLVRVQDT
ncbi:MAG: hypothetical protein H6718_04505 [Polyangiaceae bacterium]|nr:hypothetical protein [Polyangiaceae bacterium]MCB9609068.1 hypothetical protein [Polyangiaceae bacterium]